MFRSTLLALITLMVSALPLSVLAQGPYVGGSYTELEYADPDNDGPELEPSAAYLRLGMEPNAHIGLEARGGFGLSADERDDFELEQDHFYGGYLTLGAPVGDAFRPYAIAGYTKSRYTVRATSSGLLGTSTTEETETRDGESWGAGFDVALSDQMALNVEYMRYLDKDDLELSGLSLGLRSAF
jgi:opacity protein-like surface antigen